ncbi:MAG: bacteriohemerythrin [Myxococcota bacterium]
MFVEWTTRLSVGVEPMDAAHKRLIELMNRLHELCVDGEDRTEIRRALKALSDFTVRHFREEETYMESIRYPGLANHKHIHASLIKQLGEHASAFEAGTGPLPNGFFTFLEVWLTAHIMGIDGKYGEHARTHA